jgi:NAD+ diphosphatase
MTFSPGIYQPKDQGTSALYFIFKDGLLIVDDLEGNIVIPSHDPSKSGLQTDLLFFGSVGDKACFAGLLDQGSVIDPSIKTSNLLQLFGIIEDSLFTAGNYAYHFVNWHVNSKFCGKCGSPMQFMLDERGKKCEKFAHSVYPSISPCIIVAIVKDEKSILLAKINRPGVNLFSVLAGFVEIGETLEECVVREVHEEVGIEIQNIRYFGSHPWAFSQSLMVGFTAEYKSGQITVDGKEIPEAAWFEADSLPKIPQAGTISRKLIDWFVRESASALR